MKNKARPRKMNSIDSCEEIESSEPILIMKILIDVPLGVH